MSGQLFASAISHTVMGVCGFGADRRAPDDRAQSERNDQHAGDGRAASREVGPLVLAFCGFLPVH